jgi:hypothetical protein
MSVKSDSTIHPAGLVHLEEIISGGDARGSTQKILWEIITHGPLSSYRHRTRPLAGRRFNCTAAWERSRWTVTFP